MSLKLGDLVIRKNMTDKMLFKITEFDGKKVILQGNNLPIITIAEKDNLIKLNRNRLNNNCMRRVK